MITDASALLFHDCRCSAEPVQRTLGQCRYESCEPGERLLIAGAPDPQTGRMATSDEEQAVLTVIDRLSGRFPQLEREDIATVVHEAHHELDGNPIRDFVPVLVEHEARERLQATGAQPVRISDADTPAAGSMIRAGVPDVETVFNARV